MNQDDARHFIMNTLASYTREDEHGPVATTTTWANVRRYRFALLNLVLKDFRTRYRNMSLGILWSVINPLVMLGVLIVVFSFIHPQKHAHFFPVFLLIGMVIYNIFSLCLPPATNSIQSNVSLVKKVIFPRELIPLSVVLSQVVHAGIQTVLLFTFVLIFSVPFAWTWLWIIPAYFILFVYILGVSFAASALAVTYRDILYVVESGLKVLFWLTPIFYDLAQVRLNLPRPLYFVYLLNPMAGCIDAVRRGILRGQHPDWESFLVALVVSIFTGWFGWLIFRKRQALFADRI